MDEAFFKWLEEEKGVALSAQQRAAVTAVEGAGLLVATPGSGKTTVIVCRTAYLTRVKGVPPERILTLTYGKQSQRDMERRFAALFPELVGPRFSTIHALSLGVLRRYAEGTGGEMFALMTDGGKVIRALLAQQIRGYVSEDLLAGVTSMLEYASNAMVDARGVKDLKVEGCDFPALHAAYTQYKRERRLMDFGDLLIFSHRALQKHPWLLDAYRRQYAYVQIDEAQDTSPIQQRIADLIAGEGGRLFLVGDEDQSIYGFRGADPAYMMAFEQTHPGARVLYMESNYRCAGAIVRAAGNVIQYNAFRREKHMRAVRQAEGRAEKTELRDWNAQAEAVCERARSLAPGRTLGVLYRNNDSLPAICDALLRAGIPFHVRYRDEKPGLFSHFTARNLRSLIRLSFDPTDGEAFFDVRNRICRGIPQPLATRLRRGGEDVFASLYALMPLPAQERQELARKADAIAGFKTMRAYPAVGGIIDEFNLDGWGANAQKTDALLSLAMGVETLEQYVEKLDSLERVLSGDPPDSGQVYLSTIHAAKGLEYDEVMLIDGKAGVLPASDRRDTPEERRAFEEETRLMYVAATRARERFTFLYSTHSHGSRCAPSLYLDRLFPPPPAKRDVPLGAANRGRAFAPSKTRAEISLEGLAGKRVKHIKFGEGVVLSVRGEIGAVRFADGERTLDLKVSLGNGILTREEN